MSNLTPEKQLSFMGIPIIETTENIQKDEVFQRKYIYALNLEHLSLIEKRKCFEKIVDF